MTDPNDVFKCICNPVQTGSTSANVGFVHAQNCPFAASVDLFQQITELRRALAEVSANHKATLDALAESKRERDDRVTQLDSLLRVKEERISNLDAEVERLAWNLAGCLTIAESEKPTKYAQPATPALDAVNRLAAKFKRLRERAESLAQYSDHEPLCPEGNQFGKCNCGLRDILEDRA